jgi:predicted nucleic acid-binding protein
MNRYVLDASVIVKWLIPESPTEHHVEQALALLTGLRDTTIAVRQPPHWLAEVAAVGVRLIPDTIADDIADMQELGIITETATQAIWKTACALSLRLHHHLFDTLYHAVALECDALLITADEHYFRKAHGMGHIMLLADFHDA